jgi:hypothetical protein
MFKAAGLDDKVSVVALAPAPDNWDVSLRRDVCCPVERSGEGFEHSTGPCSLINPYKKLQFESYKNKINVILHSQRETSCFQDICVHRSGWRRGNSKDLYVRGTRFESRPCYRLS